MTRCRRAAVPLLALLAVLAAPARADGPWSATVAATTDYVLRGVSQSYGGAALQGGLNYQHASGWFGGVWASNVDPYPGDHSSTEINAYGGFGWALSPDWSARTSYTRYVYAWDRRPAPYDYGEFAVTLGFQDRLSATVSYQPDSSGYSTQGYVRDRSAAAYELTGRWPLPYGFALTGGVGYYDLTRLYHASYWAGGAGLSYVHGRFGLDLTRFFSDGTVRRLFEDASADGRWTLTGAWRF
jgi:uncharacterized protein (TIGR02001 family)